MAHRLRARLRQAIKHTRGGGATKSAHTVELIGCSIEYFMQHIEKQFKPDMSWDRFGEFHIDHIKPCASFDLNDPMQQKACFSYKNMAPLWAIENMKKGTKLDYHQNN